MRVKKAKKVKMSGAQMNSYSSRKEMRSKACQPVSSKVPTHVAVFHQEPYAVCCVGCLPSPSTSPSLVPLLPQEWYPLMRLHFSSEAPPTGLRRPLRAQLSCCRQCLLDLAAWCVSCGLARCMEGARGCCLVAVVAEALAAAVKEGTLDAGKNN
jgi:hypothetical protein